MEDVLSRFRYIPIHVFSVSPARPSDVPSTLSASPDLSLSMASQGPGSTS